MMKTVILAGGLGTRLGEETQVIPKPMVQIGGHPILWHIMKIYSHYGCRDFVILTGYLSHAIKNFFLTYYERYSDLTVDMERNRVEAHEVRTEPWKVSMLYTGENTMTGGRIARARKYIGNEPFLLTYGDGVADVDIGKVLEFHKQSGKLCTLTAVQVAGRFGTLAIDRQGKVCNFAEKPMDDTSWINGGPSSSPRPTWRKTTSITTPWRWWTGEPRRSSRRRTSPGRPCGRRCRPSPGTRSVCTPWAKTPGSWRFSTPASASTASSKAPPGQGKRKITQSAPPHIMITVS